MESFLFYSTILLAVSQVVVFFLLFLIFRQFGEVYLSTKKGIEQDGLNIGEKAPDFKGSAVLSNETISWKWEKDKPTLIAFISPRCSACKELLAQWNGAYDLYKGSFHFLLVSLGNQEENKRIFQKQKLDGKHLLDPMFEILSLYQVRVTPFAYVVDQEGHIQRKGLCYGKEDMEYLLSPDKEDMKNGVEPSYRLEKG